MPQNLAVKRINGFRIEFDRVVFQPHRIDRRFQNCKLLLCRGRNFKVKFRENGIELVCSFFRSGTAHCICDLSEDVFQKNLASGVNAEMRVFEHPREQNPVAKRGRVTMRATEQAGELVAHCMPCGGLRYVDRLARGVRSEEHSGVAAFRVRQIAVHVL